MKKILLFLFLFYAILISCNHDKDPLPIFKDDLNNYTIYLNNKNWDKVLDFIYPKIFKFIPKDVMKNKFIAYADTLGIVNNFQFIKIDSISNIIYYDNEKFCKVYYNAKITSKVTVDYMNIYNNLKQLYIDNYGVKNVMIYDDEMKLVTNTHQFMIAISNKHSNIWKYVQYDDNKFIKDAKIIPLEVFDKLGL